MICSARILSRAISMAHSAPRSLGLESTLTRSKSTSSQICSHAVLRPILVAGASLVDEGVTHRLELSELQPTLELRNYPNRVSDERLAGNRDEGICRQVGVLNARLASNPGRSTRTDSPISSTNGRRHASAARYFRLTLLSALALEIAKG